MVVIRPSEVRFGTDVWDGVERVAIDRVSAGTVRDWDEGGASLVFADVARYQVRARVWQALDRTDLGGPIPGELETLRVELSAGSDVGERLVRLDAVVESVQHEVSGGRAVRVIALIGVSDEPDEDPVTITEVS